MKTAAFLLLLLAGLAHAKPPRIDPAKEKDLRHLLQLTGVGQLGPQIKTQMLESFKANMPNVPANVWADVSKSINADELVDYVLPVYDKQFTAAEVKELIRFYESPTGQKSIKVMPAITQESMAIEKEWGREISDKVIQQLRQKGHEKKK